MASTRRILVVMYETSGSNTQKLRLVQELKKSRAWWHHIKTGWIVVSDETADECSERLLNLLGRDDKLLVLEVTPLAAHGLLSESGWAWIDRNLDV